MSNLLRFLSFVPPILLFIFPAYSQIEGKLTQLPGSGAYQVSIVSSVDWSPPGSTTSSATVTLRADAGKASLINFQSITGDWDLADLYYSPVEAPQYDYFSFSLQNPLTNVNYVVGDEIILFSFENANGCAGFGLVDNTSDPFASNNTLSVNAENNFSIVQAGVGQNAYAGNTSEYLVECPTLNVKVVADINPLLCNGDLTSITIEAENGTEPYTVIYTNVQTGLTGSVNIFDFEGSVIINDLPGGTYNFSITDFIDSIGQSTFEIIEPAPIIVDLEPAPATCTGSGDGAVRVSSISGPSGPILNNYQYFWDIDPFVSNVEIDSINDGSYSVTVVDANGCEAYASTEVGTWTFFSISDEIVDVSCYGERDGIIDITPIGASSPYTYEWSPNANTGNLSSAWMLGPGDYVVTVTASSGICTTTASYTVEEPPVIEVDFMMENPICFDDPAFLNILAVENAVEPYNIDIIGGYEDAGNGKFKVEAGIPLRLVVEDNNGCRLSEDFLIPAKQEMWVDLGEDRSIKYGEEVYIDSDVFPLSGVELIWTPENDLSCSACPNPTAKPTESTTYSLQLIDDDGCIAEDEISIQVTKSRDIFIPNAFSPNKDGINDIFHPYGGFEIVAIQSMLVFDRWGNLVYENSSPFSIEDEESGWNGKMRGDDLDPGTYLYTMNVEFIDGEVVLFSGSVNLMR